MTSLSQTDTVPLLLTPSQLARVMRWSRSKVHRMLARGDVVSVTVGATRYIPIAELERLQRLSKVTLRPVGVTVGDHAETET